MAKEINISRKESQEGTTCRNFKRFGLDINPVVSLVAGLLILSFCLYAFLNLERAYGQSVFLHDFITANLSWVFIISSNFIVAICLYFAFSRLGSVRIGGVNSTKEFSNFAWYSMLISAGMGIGLMFWAVGEPLTHFHVIPPIFDHADTPRAAMATTFFHWGFHPWAIYALMALALAFFSYNRNMPLSLRSVFYFLFKDKVFGIVGDIIDAFAVLSVLFGLAASLGLGAQQINSGLEYLLGVNFHVNVQLIVITVITLVAIFSILKGLHKGIKFFATLNMRLALILMLTVFLLGPTLEIIRLFSNSLGLYLGSLLENASFVGGNSNGWQNTWTVPFLAWWIAWSPFVGMFIARISRGRTVREMILGVLLIPSVLSFFWLTVFGGTAISANKISGGTLFAIVEDNLPVALFEMMNYLKMPGGLNFLRILIFVLATVLVVIYFVTSSDSGSLVVDKIASGGKIGSPARQRVFWATLEGLLAATLLLVGGEKAVEVLRTAVTVMGLPLAVILVLMVFSLIRGVGEAHADQMWTRDVKRIKKILAEKQTAHMRKKRDS